MSLLGPIFWISVFLVFYVYFGYPLILWAITAIVKKPVRKKDILPSVTILIAAYNEEECIAATLDNKLSLDYPADRMELIVISDSSDDKTDEIVMSYAQRGVRLLRQSPRAGKTAALNMAVPHATGEILVFSDANSIYATDALKKLTRNFADPSVGYVTGKMIYTNPDGSPVGDGCSAYMKYENWLREKETLLGSVVGVDGGIDAMRKDLYSPLRADQLPDFVQPLKVVEKSYRVIYESEAILKEAALKDSSDEYRMRVRVTLRALWALWDMRKLLVGKGGWLFSWQLWSHKVLRYFCFVFLIAVLISNAFLISNITYAVIFVLQIAGYCLALLSPVLIKKGVDPFGVRLLNYFVLVNFASLKAALKFLKGEKVVIWAPRTG